VRAALARVEQGEVDVDVPVYDASEVGLLQAGFNRMVAGLRERERLRDLFGRHVGEDVARRALESDIELGGELRTAAVLFVDIVGSTQLATETAPERVVDLLNRFFGIVVEVVESHGGWVNKFEGDAALCVFGVPVPDDDSAGRALAAARELAERLRTGDVPAAGIGVSAGEVVAGNIGASHRLEYTVIGDPVNEAARLTDLAKGEPGRVLASEAAVVAAGESEAAHWELGDEVELRGRGKPTRLARPAGDRALNEKGQA
jgi:adenylate cyclase